MPMKRGQEGEGGYVGRNLWLLGDVRCLGGMSGDGEAVTERAVDDKHSSLFF
jgi:hypothetical protein